MRKVAGSKLNKQSRTDDEGWSSSLGIERGANNPSLYNTYVKKHSNAGCLLWRQAVSCECGNEPSGSVKCGQFFD